MFIRSPNRNMTGKTRVFIFLSLPSLFFPSSPPPRLRSSLSPLIPLSPPPPPLLLFACLPHPLCTPLKDEMTSSAAPLDIIFSMLNIAYPSSLLLLFLDILVLYSAKYAVSSDWCSKGYLTWIQPEAFLIPSHFLKAQCTPRCDVSVSSWRQGDMLM